jgi:hypothetical protein
MITFSAFLPRILYMFRGAGRLISCCLTGANIVSVVIILQGLVFCFVDVKYSQISTGGECMIVVYGGRLWFTTRGDGSERPYKR